MASDNAKSLKDAQSDTNQAVSWFPRRSIRETYWIYHVDALRIHDIREIGL